MSTLFTRHAVAYMDDGTSNTIPATTADVCQWAAERGLALVPVEPTKAMSAAGMQVLQEYNSWATGVYKAMIAEAMRAQQ